MRSLLIFSICTFCITSALPVQAKKKIVLLPLVERDNPPKEITRQVFELLSKAASTVTNLQILTGKVLRKKMDRKPKKVLTLCGANISCLAGYARKAGGSILILGKAVPYEAGAKITFVAIKTKSKKIVRKIPLIFDSVASVKPILGAAFFEILGVTKPGFLLVAKAKGNVLVDNKKVGRGPGPHKLSPGLHTVTIAGRQTSAMILPGKTKKLKFKDMPILADESPEPVEQSSADKEPPLTEIQNTEKDTPEQNKGTTAEAPAQESPMPPPLVSEEKQAEQATKPVSSEPASDEEAPNMASETSQSEEKQPSQDPVVEDDASPAHHTTKQVNQLTQIEDNTGGVLFWSGIALSIVGAGGLGTGAYFYLDYSKKRSQLNAEIDPSTGISQVEAQSRVKAFNDDNQPTSNTSLMLITSGAVTGGVGLLFLVLDSLDLNLPAVATYDGRQLILAWQY
jgi:hypothetical protein